MKNQILHFNPVYLSGGGGKRLWPLSTSSYPKQFLKLNEKDNLFQNTISRILKIDYENLKISKSIVISNEKYRFHVKNSIYQLFNNYDFKILLEPESKNTLNSLSMVSFYLNSINNDHPMVVMPVDHEFSNHRSFKSAIYKAISSCHDGSLLNFIGIKPYNANENYGYIETKLDNVLRFHEKPSLANAKKFLRSGNYFWNSGIFILKPSTWISLLEQYQEKIYLHSLNVFNNFEPDGNFIRTNSIKFKKLKSLSIDYGIMEILDHKKMLSKIYKYTGKWTDYGSWSSISSLLNKDLHKNYYLKKSNIKNSNNNIIYNSTKKLFLSNIDNSLIVENNNNVLIGNNISNDDLNYFYELDKNSKSNDNFSHRPWGWFHTILDEDLYKVKKITILPNSSISLQKHKFRSEHWVVVKGIALVTLGKDKLKLSKNESIFIKKNQKHKITNNTKDILEIIEVQTGSYLGEDDIIRFEDEYGRK